MELAPAWMSYTKESSSSQGTRFLGKERERGPPKYGRQLSFSHVQTTHYHNSTSLEPERTSTVPFACSVSSPPAPHHAPASILGEPQPRVLNRSKSSPGFGSPKSKQKKSPDRAFSSFKPPPKPKAPKPPLSPSSYMKSHSQPNLFDTEKTNNWHHAQKAHQQSLSPSSLSLSATSSSTSNTAASSSSATTSTSSSTTVQSPVPPSTSPPLPSPSSPPVIVPEIDKLKTLIPATGPPPKSVRPRVMVAPPLPLAKKAPASPLPSNNNNSNITNNINGVNTTNLITNSNPNGNVPNASGSSAPNGMAAYFRKTASEPSLMHHTTKTATSAQDAAIAFRRAEALAKKVRALESEKAQAQLLKEAVASKQPKRSNFFQHVIKQEEQGVPMMEDESPVGMDGTTEPYSPATSPPLHSPSSLTNSSSTTSSTSSLTSSSTIPLSPPPPSGIKSPLPEDSEDEERFLRTLGWVPDEEDPVPVLEEDEIRDVRVKIFLSRGAKTQEDDSEGEAANVEIGVK